MREQPRLTREDFSGSGGLATIFDEFMTTTRCEDTSR